MLSLCAVASPEVGQGLTARAILLAAGGNPIMGNPGEDFRMQSPGQEVGSKVQAPDRGPGQGWSPREGHRQSNQGLSLRSCQNRSSVDGGSTEDQVPAWDESRDRVSGVRLPSC